MLNHVDHRLGYSGDHSPEEAALPLSLSLYLLS